MSVCVYPCVCTGMCMCVYVYEYVHSLEFRFKQEITTKVNKKTERRGSQKLNFKTKQTRNREIVVVIVIDFLLPRLGHSTTISTDLLEVNDPRN